MKALTLQQPWAWAIFHAGKDIENRPRRTHFRGTVAIHTSQKSYPGWEDYYPRDARKVPPVDQWITGAIIGFVEIVDCIEDSSSEWFFGPFGYVLKSPRLLKQPIPCKGALGFWNLPPDVLS